MLSRSSHPFMPTLLHNAPQALTQTNHTQQSGSTHQLLTPCPTCVCVSHRTQSHMRPATCAASLSARAPLSSCSPSSCRTPPHSSTALRQQTNWPYKTSIPQQQAAATPREQHLQLRRSGVGGSSRHAASAHTGAAAMDVPAAMPCSWMLQCPSSCSMASRRCLQLWSTAHWIVRGGWPGAG